MQWYEGVGMRTVFFSITLLLIWISRNQYYQSRSVLPHISHDVISNSAGSENFIFIMFLITNKTACNQFNFFNIYRV
jgi:hypothetical protein